MWYPPAYTPPKEPCPRETCKSTSISSRSRDGKYFYFCNSCKTLGPKAETALEAREAWEKWSKEQRKGWEAR